MEPGLAAAAYTAETAVEGVAAGAYAITRPTVPLKARFHRLASPNLALKRSSHSLNVITNKAYIFGGDGDAAGSTGDTAMHVVTLPTDLNLGDTDYQEVKTADSGENVPAARAGHCSCVIGERIYIFGGSTPTGSSDVTAPPNSPLEEDGRVYVFHTTSKIWDVLNPNKEGCRGGIPVPRNYASSSGTAHPLPIRKKKGEGRGQDQLMTDEARLRLSSSRGGEAFTATDEQQSEGYGTIFLHGGYDSEWKPLRDVWAFDVASCIWSRWPDVPESEVDDGEGNICCIESRLWRCGDGFGKIAHLDIVRHQFDDITSKGEISVGPKTGDWEVHSFGVMPGHEELEKEVEKKMGGKPTNTQSLFPPRRKRSGFIPVTTGQGREYLLLFMGETGPKSVLDDVWSYQIGSEKKSAAAFKDAIRGMIGRQTGLEQWAKADVLESDREDGVLDFPKGLSRFGSSSGGDWGDGVVIWGGITEGGEVSGDGWILTLE
jgi:Galactose oxidase, central domain/Kelch motif